MGRRGEVGRVGGGVDEGMRGGWSVKGCRGDERESLEGVVEDDRRRVD